MLHQDNALPYTANTTQLEIDVLGFQWVDLPSSPDLSQLDLKHFSELKNHLRGTRFHSRDKIMNALLSFNKTYLRNGLKKCIPLGWIATESV